MICKKLVLVLGIFYCRVSAKVTQVQIVTPDLSSEPTVKSNDNTALKEFLENYSKKFNKPEQVTHDPIEANSKSKSWSLLHSQRHKHPYDDRKGWVSLEPVPWSVSKISKWHSNVKPTSDPWEEHTPWTRPTKPTYDYNRYKPTQSSYSFDDENKYDYNEDKFETYRKPDNNRRYGTYQNTDYRPSFPRPTAIYEQKVHVQTSGRPYSSLNKKPVKHNHNSQDCHHNYEIYDDSNHNRYDDIITDDRAPSFPQHSTEHIRRRGTAIDSHPETHPANGDGEWVLLSTTRAYKPPKSRQRSLAISTQKPQLINSHRMVRLTVLPPLKDSKINMTTSHGGLLQVDSSSETVEQAKNKLDKEKQKKKILKRKQKNSYTDEANSMIATVQKNRVSDPSAILAAVGAGMIPATMAMLVPMAMNGRRRKRDVDFVQNVRGDILEITLQPSI